MFLSVLYIGNKHFNRGVITDVCNDVDLRGKKDSVLENAFYPC